MERAQAHECARPFLLPCREGRVADSHTPRTLPAFTRSLTTIYTIVILSLHTRVQLNILGRYSYIRSVRELEQSFHPTSIAASGDSTVSAWWSYLAGAVGVQAAAEESPKARGGLEDEIDQETEMAYLTFSWWLMNVGWRELKERVALAVDEVFGPCVLGSRCEKERSAADRATAPCPPFSFAQSEPQEVYRPDRPRDTPV